MNNVMYNSIYLVLLSLWLIGFLIGAGNIKLVPLVLILIIALVRYFSTNKEWNG